MRSLTLALLAALVAVGGCETRPSELASSARLSQDQARGESGTDKNADDKAVAHGTSGADDKAVAYGTSGADDKAVAYGTSGADCTAPSNADTTPGTSGADRAISAIAPGTSGADSALVASQQRAHGVLMRHCASCHTSSSPQAKPGALAIFDLDRADWHRNLGKERLESAKGRVDNEASPEDKSAFADFVAVQSAHLAGTSGAD